MVLKGQETMSHSPSLCIRFFHGRAPSSLPDQAPMTFQGQSHLNLPFAGQSQLGRVKRRSAPAMLIASGRNQTFITSWQIHRFDLGLAKSKRPKPRGKGQNFSNPRTLLQQLLPSRRRTQSPGKVLKPDQDPPIRRRCPAKTGDMPVQVWTDLPVKRLSLS